MRRPHMIAKKTALTITRHGVRRMIRHTNRSSAIGSAVAIGLLTACVGCDSRPQVAPVSGLVTLDGQPLKFGSVMFQQTTGGQPAVGTIQSDGSFTLSTFEENDGAIVGQHMVRVACYSTQDPAVADQAGDSLGELLIPRKYTVLASSGLTADVPEEGLDSVELKLESNRRRR